VREITPAKRKRAIHAQARKKSANSTLETPLHEVDVLPWQGSKCARGVSLTMSVTGAVLASKKHTFPRSLRRK
jgi:hypothetical protein